MMPSAFSRALAQLPDPTFRAVLLRSLLLAIVVFVAAALLVGWWISGLGDLRVAGWQVLSAEWLAGLGGFAAFLLTAWLLFPAIAGLFLSFFLEEVVDAVERRHYPGEPPGRSPPVLRALFLGLRFAAVLIVLNLVALLLVYWIPVVNIVVYLLLNGYLLGREYFELVGFYHLDPALAGRMRRDNRGTVLLAGIVIAGLFLIPFVNLVAPLIATAAMTHIFHGLRRA